MSKASSKMCLSECRIIIVRPASHIEFVLCSKLGWVGVTLLLFACPGWVWVFDVNLTYNMIGFVFQLVWPRERLQCSRNGSSWSFSWGLIYVLWPQVQFEDCFDAGWSGKLYGFSHFINWHFGHILVHWSTLLECFLKCSSWSDWLLNMPLKLRNHDFVDSGYRIIF